MCKNGVPRILPPPRPLVSSPHQSRKVERKPLTVMLPSPMRRNTVASAMFDKGPRERASSEGNTNSMASIRVNMMEQGRSRFAERHSLLAAGGVIHVRASQSISAHVALRTSFVRQAVRIMKASALEAISVRSLSRAMKAGTSA